MELSNYDGKRVRVRDQSEAVFTGIADYCPREYGREENGIKVGDYLICESQIASIEEIEVHGTAELRTEKLLLRRYRTEDAEVLYRQLGTDPASFRYSGWNPYATLEMARETVRRFIAGCQDEHFYGWVIDLEGVLIGTVGAYDYRNDRIEIGLSLVRSCWGRGYATEALKKVLEYLTENEGIPCVTAWCAEENIGSKRVMEKAGMRLVRTEKDGLTVDGRTYDKLFYEYRVE